MIYKRMPNVVFLISKTKHVDSAQTYTIRSIGYFCSLAQKSNTGLGHLVVEVSRSHTERHINRDTETYTQRHRETQRHTETQRDTETHIHTHTHTHLVRLL